jgi:hypothetical protein
VPTDDDLIRLVRRGFAQSTADVAPSPGLARTVRRRHVAARRRRLAVGVTIPTAAVAAGAAFSLGGRTANHKPSADPVRSTAPTSAPIKPASYRILLNAKGGPTTCPASVTRSVGKTADPSSVWVWSANGRCAAAAVGFTTALPAGAKPIKVGTLSGLYGTTDRANRTRTVFAPLAPGESEIHPAGGWNVLVVPADAPDKEIAEFFVPTL